MWCCECILQMYRASTCLIFLSVAYQKLKCQRFRTGGLRVSNYSPICSNWLHILIRWVISFPNLFITLTNPFNESVQLRLYTHAINRLNANKALKIGLTSRILVAMKVIKRSAQEYNNVCYLLSCYIRHILRRPECWALNYFFNCFYLCKLTLCAGENRRRPISLFHSYSLLSVS